MAHRDIDDVDIDDIDQAFVPSIPSYIEDDRDSAAPSRSATPPIPPLTAAAYEDFRRRQRAESYAHELYEDAEERRTSEQNERERVSNVGNVIVETINDMLSPALTPSRSGREARGRRNSQTNAKALDITEEFHEDAERLPGSFREATFRENQGQSRREAVKAANAEAETRSASHSPTRANDLFEVMVGKPREGTGNYDKPNGDSLEPIAKANANAAARQKGASRWVRLNASGNMNRLALEKSKIATLLRVPMRDLRVLEPAAADSYSAAMLCRERAIVVNLEQIKVLITAEEVIMTDSQTATVTHFLPELQTRLLRRKRLQEEKEAATAALMLPATLSVADLQGMTTSLGAQAGPPPTAIDPRNVSTSTSHSPTGSIDLSHPGRAGGGEEVFPFEFVALEVALEMVCNALEVEANKIELDGKPALEALRKQVNNVNLERVRRMKNRLVRITGRVSKVRDEIQRYLDDDSDMRDMYLTRKAKLHSAPDGAANPETTPPVRTRREKRAGMSHQLSHGRSPLGSHGVHTTDYHYDAYDDDKDLQELEDLLETYFTHIDSTYHSLNGLNEYIDDLEDLIEIELDSQRNQLIKLELILTSATLCLTAFSVVVGIFGMNIANGIEHKHSLFLVVVILGSVSTLGFFLILLRVCRYYKLF